MNKNKSHNLQLVIHWISNGKRIKLYKTRVHENNISSKPGRISIIDKKKVFISCAKDDLELIEIQMENKSRMLTSEWIKGAQIKTGDYFG